MADLFSTNVLLGVVQSLLTAPSWLLKNFFPMVQTEESEEIHFDVISKTRRVAPFVSPLVAGKVVASQGFVTTTFKPAYVKDKRVWNPGRALKRSPGEQIGGSMSPQERQRALLAYELQDQVDCVMRRLELMAAEALRLGTVTVSGDLYPTKVVDFGRAAGQTIALAGGAKWNAATTVKGLDNLKTWAQIIFKATGSWPIDVVMDADAFVTFSGLDQVKDRLTLQRMANVMPTMTQGVPLTQGAVFMGTIDGFNIWQYSDYYTDANGVDQPILPSGTVIMGSAAIEGVQCYGAIQDDAVLAAVPYYAKSWTEQDPSVRYLLMQSAPLVVPVRPNASACITVL